VFLEPCDFGREIDPRRRVRANRITRSPAMGRRGDGIAVEPVPLGPLPPNQQDGGVGIHERSIHVEEHRTNADLGTDRQAH